MMAQYFTKLRNTATKNVMTTLQIPEYPQDIYSAIKPLYYFSKVLGLAPFSYIYETTENLKCISIRPSRIGTIYTILLLLVVFTCHTINLYGRITYVYPSMVATIIVTDLMALMSSSICTMASFVIAITSGQEKLVRIFKKITYVDEILLVNPDSVYRKMRICLIVELGLLFCIIGIMSVYDYFVVTFALGNIALLYVPPVYLIFWVMYTMDTQFVNLIFLLWHRYKILNCHLITKYNFDKRDKIWKTGQFCHSDTDNFKISRTVSLGKKISISKTSRNLVLEIEESIGMFNFHQNNFSHLRTLRVLHSMLTDTALLTTSMYGFQVLLDISNTLIRTTTCLYYGITYAVDIHNDISDEDLEKKKHVFALNACWVPIFITKLMTFAMSCHLASSEANNTAALLQKMLLSENLKQNVRSEIQEFLQQVLNQKLKFKACGFFKIDLSMLSAITVTVFTYLLILMQFYIPQ